MRQGVCSKVRLDASLAPESCHRTPLRGSAQISIQSLASHAGLRGWASQIHLFNYAVQCEANNYGLGSVICGSADLRFETVEAKYSDRHRASPGLRLAQLTLIHPSECFFCKYCCGAADI